MSQKPFTARPILFVVAMLTITGSSAAQQSARPEAVVTARRPANDTLKLPPKEALKLKKFYSVKWASFTIEVLGTCLRDDIGVHCPLRGSNEAADKSHLRLEQMFAVLPDGIRVRAANGVSGGTAVPVVDADVQRGWYVDFAAHFTGIDPTVRVVSLNFDTVWTVTRGGNWGFGARRTTYGESLSITGIPIR